MSGDKQEYYRRMGYHISSSGAVEFYYVVFRTHLKTKEQGICMLGGFSWSQHRHDPAVTIQSMKEKDREYRYSRLGPFPNRAMAESKAIDMSVQMFKDPTHYGIYGTGGLKEISAADYRKPYIK